MSPDEKLTKLLRAAFAANRELAEFVPRSVLGASQSREEMCAEIAADPEHPDSYRAALILAGYRQAVDEAWAETVLQEYHERVGRRLWSKFQHSPRSVRGQIGNHRVELENEMMDSFISHAQLELRRCVATYDPDHPKAIPFDRFAVRWIGKSIQSDIVAREAYPLVRPRGEPLFVESVAGFAKKLTGDDADAERLSWADVLAAPPSWSPDVADEALEDEPAPLPVVPGAAMQRTVSGKIQVQLRIEGRKGSIALGTFPTLTDALAQILAAKERVARGEDPKPPRVRAMPRNIRALPGRERFQVHARDPGSKRGTRYVGIYPDLDSALIARDTAERELVEMAERRRRAEEDAQ